MASGSLVSVMITVFSQANEQEHLSRTLALARAGVAHRGRVGEAVLGAIVDVQAEGGEEGVAAMMAAVREVAAGRRDLSRTLMRRCAPTRGHVVPVHACVGAGGGGGDAQRP